MQIRPLTWIGEIENGQHNGGFSAKGLTKNLRESLRNRCRGAYVKRFLWGADIEEATAADDYERGLRRIADLAPVLDRFFVEVLLMAEDPPLRRRLRLLVEHSEHQHEIIPKMIEDSPFFLISGLA